MGSRRFGRTFEQGQQAGLAPAGRRPRHERTARRARGRPRARSRSTRRSRRRGRCSTRARCGAWADHGEHRLARGRRDRRAARRSRARARRARQGDAGRPWRPATDRQLVERAAQLGREAVREGGLAEHRRSAPPGGRRVPEDEPRLDGAVPAVRPRAAPRRRRLSVAPAACCRAPKRTQRERAPPACRVNARGGPPPAAAGRSAGRRARAATRAGCHGRTARAARAPRPAPASACRRAPRRRSGTPARGRRAEHLGGVGGEGLAEAVDRRRARW